MYKKNTQCNKCKHYDTENHRCDAFCSFMKETCDDVYNQGRVATVDECIKTIKGLCSGWRYGIVKAIIDKLEELKEQEE